MMQGEATMICRSLETVFYAYYIFIGYYLFKYRRHIRLSQRSAALLCGAGLILTFAVTLGVTAATRKHYEGRADLCMSAGSCGIRRFFPLCHKNGKYKAGSGKNGQSGLSICSAGVLLEFYRSISCFWTIIRKYMAPTDLSAWIAVPALTVGIGAVSFSVRNDTQKVPDRTEDHIKNKSFAAEFTLSAKDLFFLNSRSRPIFQINVGCSEYRIFSGFFLLHVISHAADCRAAQNNDDRQVDQRHKAHKNISSTPHKTELHDRSCQDDQRSDDADTLRKRFSRRASAEVFQPISA